MATDDQSQNSASEAVKQSVEDANTEASPTSIFVNSEPIREDQVQNAVKFLSHPKVSGSPVMYRRSFLERKGLTKEEIDEAFRRVPDSAPPATTTPPVVTNQTPNQALPPPPPAASPAGPVATVGIFSPSRYHWTHAILAVGFLAASGAGTVVIFKKSIVPRLKSWIRKVVLEEEQGEGSGTKIESKPSFAEEAALAAKSAAAAAADVARVSHDMLVTKSEEKRYFGELMNLLDVQVREMKSMSNSIKKLEEKSDRMQEDRVPVSSSRPVYTNGSDIRSGRPVTPPAAVEPSPAPHPKSYMEIMAMVQRGEKPPNIREINDQPPDPNQPVSNPRLTPKPKPWEVNQVQNNGYNPNVQDYSGGVNYQSNGTDSSVPWWQQKNVRITEVDAESENTNGSSSANERPPPQRTWVPPQAPPVAMAEAAAAIRQPKKAVVQNEQLTDDELLARSTEVSDDLQRITKLSESGGLSEINQEDNSYSEA
jgi:peroxin-14